MKHHRITFIVILFLFLASTIKSQECEGSLGPNLFTAGDFGSGAPFALAEDPRYAPGYLYVRDGPPSDGEYIITNDMSKWSFLFDTWLSKGDNSSDPNGYMMVVNASFEPGLFYEETIENLCENTLFEFSADIINLIRRGADDHSDPSIDFLIDDEIVLRTGFIPKNESWNKFSFTFSTLPGQTSVKLSLRNNAPGGRGNDLALDNISFGACGPLGEVATTNGQYACIEEFPVTLTALLDGIEDPARRYQWEARNSESDPWEIIISANGSSYQLSESQIGSKIFRFASSATEASFENEKCRFYSAPFEIIIPQREFELQDTLCGGTSLAVGMQNITTPGRYSLALVAASGCDSILNITIDTVKRETLTGITILSNPNCFELENGSVSISNILGGYPPYHISIDNQAYAGVIADNLSAGPHLLKLEDRFGCFYEEDILLNDPPEFTVNLGPDLDLILGDVATITATTSEEITSTTWNPELVDFNDQTEFTFLPTTAGQIFVAATTAKGCTDSDTILIDIDKEVNIYIPNIFSPNDDNINDEYYISTYGQSLSYIALFSIYDRWGNILWEVTNSSPNSGNTDQWDGRTSNGEEAQPGAYAYVMEAVLIDGSSIKRSGVITLVK